MVSETAIVSEQPVGKWQMVTIFAAFAALIWMYSPAAQAQAQEGTQTTRAETQQSQTVNLSSTIVGNQEQPKVLYIVPWKAVDNVELENQTLSSQLDIVFGHVERVELRRELSYLENLSKADKQAEK